MALDTALPPGTLAILKFIYNQPEHTVAVATLQREYSDEERAHRLQQLLDEKLIAISDYAPPPPSDGILVFLTGGPSEFKVTTKGIDYLLGVEERAKREKAKDDQQILDRAEARLNRKKDVRRQVILAVVAWILGFLSAEAKTGIAQFFSDVFNRFLTLLH